MASSIYNINKGVNRCIEFKGLKAQYIWYLGAGLVALMILFAISYVLGVNSYVCLVITLILGVFLFSRAYTLSNTYREHGMIEKAATRMLPTVIKSNSRKVFIKK